MPRGLAHPPLGPNPLQRALCFQASPHRIAWKDIGPRPHVCFEKQCGCFFLDPKVFWCVGGAFPGLENLTVKVFLSSCWWSTSMLLHNYGKGGHINVQLREDTCTGKQELIRLSPCPECFLWVWGWILAQNPQVQSTSQQQCQSTVTSWLFTEHSFPPSLTLFYTSIKLLLMSECMF